MTYLVENKDRGLVYWRAETRDDMEYRCQDIMEIDFTSDKDPFPDKEESPYTLLGVVDCSYASALNGRSVAGALFWLGGHLICWKNKNQTVVAISLTEGELVLACFAGKIVKSLGKILSQIGIPQEKATIILEDN